MTSQYKALGSVMPREYLFQHRSPLVTFELHFFGDCPIRDMRIGLIQKSLKSFTSFTPNKVLPCKYQVSFLSSWKGVTFMIRSDNNLKVGCYFQSRLSATIFTFGRHNNPTRMWYNSIWNYVSWHFENELKITRSDVPSLSSRRR